MYHYALFGKAIRDAERAYYLNGCDAWMWSCPNCGSRAVGKVGQERFFCSDCCIEFVNRKRNTLQYLVTDDGSLVSVNRDGVSVKS